MVRSTRRMEGDLRALAGKAIEHGGLLHSSGRIEWDAAGRCENPTFRIVQGIQDDYLARIQRDRDPGRVIALLGTLNRVVPNKSPAGFVLRRYYVQSGHRIRIDMHLPCRKCPACLRARARGWARRALHETTHAARTWMATFTLAPDSQAHFTNVARAKTVGDVDVSPDIFGAKVRAIRPELTKWFKRIRKASDARLRFLCVAEVHPGPGDLMGEPHFHALVHEVMGSITHEELTHRLKTRSMPYTGKPWACVWPKRRDRNGLQWRFGFTKFKLVPVEKATYVTKYLAKDSRARVIASIGYGLKNEL